MRGDGRGLYGWHPSSGVDYIRADSTAHNFKISLNGGAETTLEVQIRHSPIWLRRRSTHRSWLDPRGCGKHGQRPAQPLFLRRRHLREQEFELTGTPTANRTVTIPDNTGTVSELNLAESYSARKTFPGGDLFLGGVNAQTGTTYTILTTDANKLTTYSNALPVAVTLAVATTSGFGVGRILLSKESGRGNGHDHPDHQHNQRGRDFRLNHKPRHDNLLGWNQLFCDGRSGTGNTVTVEPARIKLRRRLPRSPGPPHAPPSHRYTSTTRLR